MNFVDMLQLYAIPWFLTMYARKYFVVVVSLLVLTNSIHITVIHQIVNRYLCITVTLALSSEAFSVRAVL